MDIVVSCLDSRHLRLHLWLVVGGPKPREIDRPYMFPFPVVFLNVFRAFQDPVSQDITRVGVCRGERRCGRLMRPRRPTGIAEMPFISAASTQLVRIIPERSAGLVLLLTPSVYQRPF
jgi:hypothetical protein